LRLLEKYDVTAEALMYRLSQVVPGEFGLRIHFLKFLDQGGTYRLVKQLNLSDLPIPPGHGGTEHYCRRWLTTRLLTELADRQHRHPKRQVHPLVGIQVSRFVDEEDDYLCLGLSHPTPLNPAVNTSVTLGFRMDTAFSKTVRFAKDRTIPHTVISTTCERCRLDETACRDRVVPPSVYRLEQAKRERTRELELLGAEAKSGEVSS
jgi:hypothetical protein